MQQGIICNEHLYIPCKIKLTEQKSTCLAFLDDIEI